MKLLSRQADCLFSPPRTNQSLKILLIQSRVAIMNPEGLNKTVTYVTECV